jgi:DNA-binding MarR family transcriptional regulator
MALKTGAKTASNPALRKKTLSGSLPKEELPFELDKSMGAEVRNTYLAFKEVFRDHLRTRQITSAQWVFLRALWSSDGINQKELARRVGVHPTTTVTAIDILAKHNYVFRERSEEDRRNVTIFLTPEGRELAGELLPLAVEFNQRATRGLSRQQIKDCRFVLAKIRENLNSKV